MRFLQTLDSISTPAQGWAATAGEMLAPGIEYFYGSNRQDILTVLLLMIALDWVSGIYAAKKDHTYSSDYGINRITRTLFLVLLPALANLLDRVMGTPGFLFFGVTFGLLYHTWMSLTANAHRAGWPMPKSIVKLVGSEIKSKTERAERKERKENR